MVLAKLANTLFMVKMESFQKIGQDQPRSVEKSVKIELADRSYDDNECCASFYPECISICIISCYIVCWRNPIRQCHLNEHSSHNENKMKCGIAVCRLFWVMSVNFHKTT